MISGLVSLSLLCLPSTGACFVMISRFVSLCLPSTGSCFVMISRLSPLTPFCWSCFVMISGLVSLSLLCLPSTGACFVMISRFVSLCLPSTASCFVMISRFVSLCLPSTGSCFVMISRLVSLCLPSTSTFPPQAGCPDAKLVSRTRFFGQLWHLPAACCWAPWRLCAAAATTSSTTTRSWTLAEEELGSQFPSRIPWPSWSSSYSLQWEDRSWGVRVDMLPGACLNRSQEWSGTTQDLGHIGSERFEGPTLVLSTTEDLGTGMYGSRHLWLLLSRKRPNGHLASDQKDPGVNASASSAGTFVAWPQNYGMNSRTMHNINSLMCYSCRALVGIFAQLGRPTAITSFTVEVQRLWLAELCSWSPTSSVLPMS